MIQRKTNCRTEATLCDSPRALQPHVCQNPLAKLGYTSNCDLEPNTTLPVPKTPKNESATDDKSAASATPATAKEPAAAPAKKRAKSAKAPAAKKTSAKKKSSVGGGAKKAATKKRSAVAPAGNDVSPSESSEPSDADIRLRAYFIAERRVQLALQGDPARDWIEARQQLIEELRQPRS